MPRAARREAGAACGVPKGRSWQRVAAAASERTCSGVCNEEALPCTEMHPEAILIREIATGPPPPLESGGGVSSWQTDGRTAGVATMWAAA